MSTNNPALLAISSLTLIAQKVLPIGIPNNRPIATKLISSILFIISLVLTPWETGYAAGTAVKWHPGHYYTIMNYGKDKSWYMSSVYKELARTPALRGLHIRYLWAELETSEGVYDFASIDKHLAVLAAQKKRLVIQIQTKSFDSDTPLVPDYLKAGIYEEGIFPFGNHTRETIIRGYSTKLWNSHVRDRLAVLIRKLGERYNSHPYFEGFGLTETAMGQPINITLSSTQVNDFYNNLLSLNLQMRTYFPNTMTFQFTNYPRPILESFINKLKEMGTALGGPDSFIEEPGLLHKGTPKGVYNYYPDLSGIVPLTPSVQPSNYSNTRWDETGYEPTVSELLAFARDQLKANYIFWMRTPGYYPKVLEMLNWSNQKSDPAGGLDATCPTAYSSCVN